MLIMRSQTPANSPNIIAQDWSYSAELAIDQECLNLIGRQTNSWSYGLSGGCLVGLWEPNPSTLPLPASTEECQNIFQPMLDALNVSNGIVNRASLNLVTFPQGQAGAPGSTTGSAVESGAVSAFLQG